jgi:hypothetical protein
MGIEEDEMRLRHRGPSFTADDKADRLIRNAILPGKIDWTSPFSGSLSDRTNIVFSQFGAWMFCAARVLLSATTNFVRHIFLLASALQVGRIAARRVVAFVADDDSGYIAACETAGNAVGVQASAPFTDGDPHSSVSPKVYLSNPRPTLIGAAFIDVAPKVFYLLRTQVRNCYRIVNRHADLLRSSVCLGASSC